MNWIIYRYKIWSSVAASCEKNARALRSAQNETLSTEALSSATSGSWIGDTH